MAGGEPGKTGNSDMSPFSFGQISAQIFKVVKVFEYAPDFREQISRIAGWFETTPAARKELEAHRRRKVRQQSTDRRLRNFESFGGFCDASRLRDGTECFQLSEFKLQWLSLLMIVLRYSMG